MGPRRCATVALAVALAVQLAGCGGTPDPQRSPAPSPSTSTTPAPDPVVDLGSLRRGEPPRIGYFEHGEYVAPDGTRTPVPAPRGVSGIAAYRGGFLVADTVYFEGTNGLTLVQGAFRRDLGPGVTGTPAASGDGRQAAWATFACPETGQTAPTVIHRACTRPGTVGEEAQEVQHERAIVSVVGFRGDEVVYSVGMAEGVF